MRILIISDVHANLYALRAILERARGYDYAIFVGDSVDYGPHPVEVIDLLKESIDIWVMGNHDNAVAWNVDCGCSSKMHGLSVYTRKSISLKMLGEEEIRFLQSLPLRRKIDIEGTKFYVVHATPRDPLYTYMHPTITPDDLKKFLYEKTAEGEKLIEADYLIVGHTHIPMLREWGSLRIINPGSVGQPRDGDNRASYAIIELDRGEILLRKARYDIEKTIEDIKKLGLEKSFEQLLIKILITGCIP